MQSKLMKTGAAIGLAIILSCTAQAKEAPFASTYKPASSQSVVLKNANVYDGLGNRLENTDVFIANGKIKQIGSDLQLDDGVLEIEARGKWVTPGIIDVHSHLGVYPSPAVHAHSDGNEVTSPVTAEAWAEHGVWPHDPGFNRARTGGVTSLLILPGSANLFGGRGVVLKNVPSRTVQGMKFPNAPYALKMACGENPKRVYGQKGGPGSRMGNFAGYRKTWIKAQSYQRKLAKYEADKAKAQKDGKEPPSIPDRDIQMETLVGALNGEILVNMHCYRGDEMVQVLDLAKEFGYQLSTFHHAVEAYKITDLLMANGTCAAMWADWGGFKMEAYDSIRENIPMVHAAGGCAIVHSDSDVGIQRLNQEAAKALADGRKAGLAITNAEAWRWLTANPAKALGIDDVTGTLVAGKNADIVLWNVEPFSVRARPEIVMVDGAVLFDRNDPARQALSDFELGQPGEGDQK